MKFALTKKFLIGILNSIDLPLTELVISLGMVQMLGMREMLAHFITAGCLMGANRVGTGETGENT